MVHCSPVMWNHPIHDDVIKWKHFPCYWPFVRGIHRRQRPVARSFDVFFDLRLNLQLSKQLRRWWFETLPRSLWHHCNEFHRFASKLAEIYVKMNIRSLTMFRRPLATIRPKYVEGHDFFMWLSSTDAHVAPGKDCCFHEYRVRLFWRHPMTLQ